MHGDWFAFQRAHIIRGHADMQYGFCRCRFVRNTRRVHWGGNIFVGTIRSVCQRGFMRGPAQHDQRTDDQQSDKLPA